MRPSKRDELVRKALGIFYRQGFHATGMDLLVAETGISKTTMFKHFRSKEELILAVLQIAGRGLSQLALPPNGEGRRCPCSTHSNVRCSGRNGLRRPSSGHACLSRPPRSTLTLTIQFMLNLQNTNDSCFCNFKALRLNLGRQTQQHLHARFCS